MIDLPRGPGAGVSGGGTTGSNPVTEVKSAADLARHQVSQTIRAVVVEAKLAHQSGATSKAVYDILLRANAAPGTAPPTTTSNSTPSIAVATGAPITEISPQAMNALRQGQALLIKTSGELPLAAGTELLASVSPGKGITINRILPAQVAATLNQALRELVPQQQGMTPLFQLLEQVSLTPTTTKLNTSVQALVATLLQILPKVEQLKNADQVRSAISNSGLFLESKVLKAVLQNAATPEATAGNKNQGASSQQATQQATQQTTLISNGLKQLSQRVREAVGVKESAASSNTGPNTASPTSDIAKLVQNDLKQLLQQLQGKLEQAQTNQSQTTLSHATGKTPPQGTPAAGSGELAKSVGTTGNAEPTQIKSADGKPLPLNTRAADGTYRYPDGRAIQTPHAEPPQAAQRSGNSKIQGYSAIQGSVNAAEPTAKSSTETYILPPLPGNIPLQPQARSRHSSGGDMADALVSVLLKNVKGAISRITLHQLASQPRSQDPGAPQPSLSFELPILHQNQVNVFQFLIEEQEHRQEQDAKQLGKRWVVQMAFDVEGLGPMLCQISMVGQSASVSFWAEWESTLEHTRNHFEYLNNVLTEMGLRVEKLQGHLGIPKADQAILQNQLVDIRT